MAYRDYGLAARLLHCLALGAPLITEASFDLELQVHGASATDCSKYKHVFVTGLARAGSTILMRRLHETGAFCSLTYRDMPFVLSPNLWRSLSNWGGSANRVARERAHGDGILIDLDSPEAFDEVFWRTFCGSAYIHPDRLSPMFADADIIEKYRRYVDLILKGVAERRYLSKNNNNFLRFEAISDAFTNAIILVPFRNPVQQAMSLLEQHRYFLRRHESDPFSRRYMTWLVHHEFGLDHRPFVFEDQAARDGACPYLDDNDLNYWLWLWVSVYSHIADNMPERGVLVCYERLCRETDNVWTRIGERIDLPSNPQSPQFSLSTRNVDVDCAPSLLRAASELYEHLVARSL